MSNWRELSRTYLALAERDSDEGRSGRSIWWRLGVGAAAGLAFVGCGGSDLLAANSAVAGDGDGDGFDA